MELLELLGTTTRLRLASERLPRSKQDLLISAVHSADRASHSVPLLRLTDVRLALFLRHILHPAWHRDASMSHYSKYNTINLKMRGLTLSDSFFVPSLTFSSLEPPSTSLYFARKMGTRCGSSWKRVQTEAFVVPKKRKLNQDCLIQAFVCYACACAVLLPLAASSRRCFQFHLHRQTLKQTVWKRAQKPGVSRHGGGKASQRYFELKL